MGKQGFVHSSEIRSSRQIDYIGDEKPEFVLDDEKKLLFLENYAGNFRKASDEAFKAKDASKLPDEVSKKDADIFMREAKADFNNAFARLAGKYFTKQLQGDGPSPENSLGKAPWHKEVETSETKESKAKEKSAFLKKYDSYLKTDYETDMQRILSFDDSFKGGVSARGDIVDKNEKNEKDFLAVVKQRKEKIPPKPEGGEKMSNYGPEDEKDFPVCRHYAPTLAIMMDAAGAPGYVFLNGVVVSSKHNFNLHAAFILESGDAIIEPTTGNVDSVYRPVIAAGNDQGATNAIDALKDGGRVIALSDSIGNKAQARMYSNDAADLEKLNFNTRLATSRYVVAIVQQSVETDGWDKVAANAKAALQAARLEDKDTHQFDIEAIKAFVKKDSDNIPDNSVAKLPNELLKAAPEAAPEGQGR